MASRVGPEFFLAKKTLYCTSMAESMTKSIASLTRSIFAILTSTYSFISEASFCSMSDLISILIDTKFYQVFKDVQNKSHYDKI